MKERNAQPPARALTKYTGTYKSDAIQSQLVVTASGNKLSLTASGNLRGTFTLRETAPHTFEAENAPQNLTVNFDVTDRRATTARVSVAGQGTFVFKRAR